MSLLCVTLLVLSGRSRILPEGMHSSVLGSTPTQRLPSNPWRTMRLSLATLTRCSTFASSKHVYSLRQPSSTKRSVYRFFREREVADLIGAGLTNREIARFLVISEATVKVHVRHILEKLHARSRAEVASRLIVRQATQLHDPEPLRGPNGQ